MLKSREPSIDPGGTPEIIFSHIVMEYPVKTGLTYIQLTLCLVSKQNT